MVPMSLLLNHAQNTLRILCRPLYPIARMSTPIETVTDTTFPATISAPSLNNMERWTELAPPPYPCAKKFGPKNFRRKEENFPPSVQAVPKLS
uniref:Uncharacterized protein n=1 Tax=Timema poppense TaxID=170557 RepID=A0A7R9DPB8_TIMPO|nr:unnamed protein product [Timema poppensis]